MPISFFNRLYVRIWLAVVLTVLVLALALGWLWRTQAERLRAERQAEQPARELIVRDSGGNIVGQSSARPVRVPGKGWEFELRMLDGKNLTVQLPPRGRAPSEGITPGPGMVPGLGMTPPPGAMPGATPPRWIDTNMQRNPGMLLWLWGIVALAVALGSYPVVRRLTQRLEGLRRSVERWGAGDLTARVEVRGHDEVAFLGERFNAAADRVQALVQAHKSLLANASHELRSPLARIRMGLELMDSTPSATLKAELARSIGELDTLIEEILLASRLDAAQHSSAVNMGQAELIDVIALAAEECARLGVPLHCETQALHIHGVPRLLRRLVRNLLDNAQRYGGSEVQMVVRNRTVPALQDQATAELEVCDRGPGVPEDERQRIFEPFYRSNRASERDGGVGLGLALVQSIAQSHGGSVQCLARPGGGACFVVQLPTTHQAAAPMGSTPASASA